VWIPTGPRVAYRESWHSERLVRSSAALGLVDGEGAPVEDNERYIDLSPVRGLPRPIVMSAPLGPPACG